MEEAPQKYTGITQNTFGLVHNLPLSTMSPSAVLGHRSYDIIHFECEWFARMFEEIGKIEVA